MIANGYQIDEGQELSKGFTVLDLIQRVLDEPYVYRRILDIFDKQGAKTLAFGNLFESLDREVARIEPDGIISITDDINIEEAKDAITTMGKMIYNLQKGEKKMEVKSRIVKLIKFTRAEVESILLDSIARETTVTIGKDADAREFYPQVDGESAFLGYEIIIDEGE